MQPPAWCMVHGQPGREKAVSRGASRCQTSGPETDRRTGTGGTEPGLSFVRAGVQSHNGIFPYERPTFSGPLVDIMWADVTPGRSNPANGRTNNLLAMKKMLTQESGPGDTDFQQWAGFEKGSGGKRWNATTSEFSTDNDSTFVSSRHHFSLETYPYFRIRTPYGYTVCKRNHNKWSDSCFHPVFLGFLLSPTLSRSSPRTEQPAITTWYIRARTYCKRASREASGTSPSGPLPTTTGGVAPRVQANSPPSSGPPRWSPGEIRAFPESTKGLITQQPSSPATLSHAATCRCNACRVVRAAGHPNPACRCACRGMISTCTRQEASSKGRTDLDRGCGGTGDGLHGLLANRPSSSPRTGPATLSWDAPVAARPCSGGFQPAWPRSGKDRPGMRERLFQGQERPRETAQLRDNGHLVGSGSCRISLSDSDSTRQEYDSPSRRNGLRVLTGPLSPLVPGPTGLEPDY
ncbi:hypothetical protein EDB80DRAFT_778221 [Ilyonectria destructans]|nr:hypothetical protein EDB80DRAFT_778221 [Ilyonectria destructans]